MLFDPAKTLINVRQASTEDLLSRVTLERGGMEPEAVTLAELELERRGVGPERREEYLAEHAGCLRDAAGLPLRCEFCQQPAMYETWGWHRLWGKLPLFPRLIRYCREHAPASR